jgi:hypothetical protein
MGTAGFWMSTAAQAFLPSASNPAEQVPVAGGSPHAAATMTVPGWSAAVAGLALAGPALAAPGERSAGRKVSCQPASPPQSGQPRQCGA